MRGIASSNDSYRAHAARDSNLVAKVRIQTFGANPPLNADVMCAGLRPVE